jgi:hypothetical protein
MALRLMALKPLMEHDRAGILMAPLFLLSGDMKIDNVAGENEFMAQASDMIPTCIAVSTSFGETIGSRHPAEVGAGQEAANASDTTAGMMDQIGRAIAKADGADFDSDRPHYRKLALAALNVGPTDGGNDHCRT